LFKGSLTSEVSTVGAGTQEFKFAPMQIDCNGAKGVKTLHQVVFPTGRIVAVLKLIKCRSQMIRVGALTIPAEKASFNLPLEIEYHADGEPNAEIINASKIKIELAEIGCTVSWAPS